MCIRIVLSLLFLFNIFDVYSNSIDYIRIFGVNSLSEKYILKNIKHNLLNSYISDSKIIDILHNSEYFDNISLYRNKNYIKIYVKERPYIKNIKIYGEKNYDIIDNILIEHNIAVGCIYNKLNINSFKKKLEQFYINDGYHNINVDINVNFNSFDGFVFLNINVKKNNKKKINSIKIVGNKFFSNSKIISLLSHSITNWTSWFLNDDNFLKGKLLADLENIKTHYLDNGFIDIQIDCDLFVESFNDNNISIFLNIYEGEKVYINDISISGDVYSYSDEINYIIHSYVNCNNVFSRKNFFDVRKVLKDFFYNKGYININVDFGFANIGNNRVNVDFLLSKTSKVLVKNITFSGNFFTEDCVLRETIPQLEGSRISFEEINFGREEIMRRGLAESVDIVYINDPKDEKSVDIVYNVDEHRTTKFVAGCSYNCDDGILLNVGSELSNFLGTGKEVVFSINKNELQSDYSFEYFDQNFMINGLGIGYSIYYRDEQLDKFFSNFEHVSSTFGGYLYYSLKIGKYKKFNFGFGCDMTRIQIYENNSSVEVKDFITQEGLDFREYFFTSNYIYNSLDKRSFPTGGMFHKFSMKLSIPGSTINYYTLHYDFNYYKYIFTKYLFNLYSVIRYGNKYGESYGFPFFKNYFIRGHNSVRGFRDKTLGPKDSNGESFGGNVLVNMKISLFTPLPIFFDPSSIRTSLFLDLGQVYHTNDFYKKHEKNRYFKVSSSIRFSIGYSLIWKTPFGIPLEISMAYPLYFEKTDRVSIFSFTFGVQHV